MVRPRGVRNDDADRRPCARKRQFWTRLAERIVHPECPCRATSGSLNRDNSRGMSQECAVPVADQVPLRRVPRKGFANLLRYPIRGRMCRDAEMHDPAALVVEDDEPEQEAERGRGDHETVDRRQAIGVICKECLPRLRGRRGVTDHVLRDGGLGDGKAKLQKNGMDASLLLRSDGGGWRWTLTGRRTIFAGSSLAYGGLAVEREPSSCSGLTVGTPRIGG